MNERLTRAKTDNCAPSPKERAVYEAVLAQAAAGVDLSSIKVQQIADAAGMGKGTLYEYFSSREEILLRTVMYCCGQELAMLGAAVEGASGFADMLGRVADFIAELVTHRVAAYRVVVGMVHAPSGELSCEAIAPIQARLAQLSMAGYRLAEADRLLAEDSTPEYYTEVLYSAMLGYATGLFRLEHDAQLTDQTIAARRDYLQRQVLKALR